MSVLSLEICGLHPCYSACAVSSPPSPASSFCCFSMHKAHECCPMMAALASGGDHRDLTWSRILFSFPGGKSDGLPLAQGW